MSATGRADHGTLRGTRILAGSYGAGNRPLRGAAEVELLSAGVLALSGIDALELPYFGPSSPWQDPSRFSGAPDGNALTLLPATTAALEHDPAFGLASTEEASRAAALDVAERARTFVHEVNAGGRSVIDTVQLHSAPGPVGASPDAFARSLAEIRSWDWNGVALSVEHCDARSREHAPAKGFLPLEDEVRLAAASGMGVVINWARSVIETRRAEGAAEHISAVGDAGVLTGVIFSGCAAVAGPYGDAWADRHVPIRAWGTGEAALAAESSLLTVDELDRCVRIALAAPELAYLGVKVKAPPGLPIEGWPGVIAANAALLHAAVERREAAAARATPAGKSH